MVDRAVTLNPNLAVAWVSRGWVAAICCEAETAIESFNQMIRLSPLDPSISGAPASWRRSNLSSCAS
jgi:adenylate cyclase